MEKKIKSKRQMRIMVFGTFDGLHPGHLNFFNQARKLAKRNLKSYLIVSVARDQNVKKIKGSHPTLNDKKRKILIEKSKLADRVVLSGIKNYLPHIIAEHPDIIALGYDQRAYVKNLKKDLKNKGKKEVLIKIVRLKPYREKIYKTHLLKKLPL